MKLNRAKNAKRNILFGCMNKFLIIVLPFVLRTVFIYTLGIEYLGLNSLFTSILSVLSLSELGFSSAAVYHMYKPVAQGDVSTVCALLNLYKKVYRVIGAIIFVIGMILIPFLPHFIKGTIPSDINLVYLYIIYLFNTVISYFLFAYLSSILIVYQRDDITSIVNICVTLGLNVAQMIILIVLKDYYTYSLMLPIFTVISNLNTAYIVHKMYPQYKCEGIISKEIIRDIKKRVGGTFIGRACSVSRNSFDSIFISIFLGLTMTAMYNNYYYVVNAVTSFLAIISNAILGGVGNSVVTEAVEKNYQDMNKMNFIYMWISGWCAICLACLLQPFMEIWMGNDLMFPFPVVVLFCIYFYVLKMGDIRTIYVQANGLWWENRYRAVAEVICNILLNYILGKLWGIYGIICATLITLFVINFGYGSQIIFQYYFKNKEVKEYYLYHIKYMAVTFAVAFITYIVCNMIHGSILFVLLGRGMICCLLPNIVYVLVYRKTEIFKISVVWMKSLLKK